MSTLADPSRRLSYAILDVFAERPLEGNPLAVFTDARELSTEQMQDLARETNLSETTFIVPRHASIERERGVRVRIFSTQEELPFAGHPTLGTAAWLKLNHPELRGSETITLDLPAGPIPVRFAHESGRAGVFGTMQQKEPVFGLVHAREAIASAVGLSLDALDPDLPIQTVSTGLPFCMVPLRSLAIAETLTIPQQSANAYLARTDAKFFYCICRADAASRADWHARMQFYSGEDPATGSASGCAAAYLVANSLARSGEQVVIEQGVEMRRPSRIYVQASGTGVRIGNVLVGGRTVPVATGSFFLS